MILFLTDLQNLIYKWRHSKVPGCLNNILLNLDVNSEKCRSIYSTL